MRRKILLFDTCGKGQHDGGYDARGDYRVNTKYPEPPYLPDIFILRLFFSSSLFL